MDIQAKWKRHDAILRALAWIEDDATRLQSMAREYARYFEEVSSLADTRNRPNHATMQEQSEQMPRTRESRRD